MNDGFVRQDRGLSTAKNIFPPRLAAQCKSAWAVVSLSLLAGLAALIAVALLAPQALGATAYPDSEYPEETAGLFFGSGQPNALFEAPTLATDVLMTVSGQVTRVRVRQRFYNPSTVWQEGIYVFPLPERSAVDRLVMTIGERRVEGQILERAEARRVFEEAAQKGQHAGLVESQRPNVFVTSVANVGPGEEVAIEIQYQDRVAFADGVFSLRFPMVVAPRYRPARDPQPSVNYQDGPMGQHLGQPIADSTELWVSAGQTSAPAIGRDVFGPVRHPAVQPTNQTTLAIVLNAGQPLGRVESPYHEIEEAAEPDGSRRITLAQGTAIADRDFVLQWSMAESGAPEARIFGEARDGDSYLLIDVLPPNLTAPPGTTLSRDLIFVIDTSGSMHGPSIEQAKFALRQALDRLRDGDRFNIIAFADQPSVLFPALQPVTPQSIGRARAAVRRLRADGGTEMLAALRLALGGQAEAGRLLQVVFLTDGAVSDEHALFQEIAAKLGDTRLFTVGIGAAPNSYFMRKAAEIGRGSFTYIGDVDEVGDRVQALLRKLETPVLTDIALDWSDTGLAAPETYPNTVPDIYAGEPIQLAARVPSHGPDALAGRLRIHGQMKDGPWERSLELADLVSAPGAAAIWGRAKFEQIEDGVYRGESHGAVRQAALTVALDYQLVTHLTSLVAVDNEVVRGVDERLNQSEIPRNLPEGWDAEKVFGASAETMPLRALPGSIMQEAAARGLGGQSFALPQGATPAGLMSVIGFGLLCLASLMLFAAARLRGAQRRAAVS